MMNELILRPAQTDDFAAILALNLQAIKATAPMDWHQLNKLHQWSDYHKVVTHKGEVIAFLLVLATGKPYQSLNYQWFNTHYESLLYVDRIVVAEQHIGQKIGGLLYQDLFVHAQKEHIDLIACEYNITPMNHASLQFHQQQGFREVTTQWLDNNRKQVSLQIAEVL